MRYYSHPNKLLSTHIENIISFDVDDELFCIVAKFHDLGKVVDLFQSYIEAIAKNERAKKADPHAFISAILFLLNHRDRLDSKLIIFGVNAIANHHGRLKSLKNIKDDLVAGKLLKLSKQQADEVYKKDVVVSFFGLSKVDFDNLADFVFENDDLSFDVFDYIRQKELFSKLIYADKYEAIFSKTKPDSNTLYPLMNLSSFKSKLAKNSLREATREFIISNFECNQDKNIYFITAPTGVGKTLISLELALKIKEIKAKCRIIYAIPFTSIIDQTVNIFESIFPNSITKHHHKSEYKVQNEEENNDYDRAKFLTESWSEPFIVSTFYQLFFALFGNENSENIKFQALKNSVVVMDEVQAIPYELWSVMQQMFEKLSQKLNTTFILMSATMPIISSAGYELADKKSIFGLQNRYRLKFLELDSKSEDERLIELKEAIKREFEEQKSVLCVVNTIKNSKKLFWLLANEFKEGVYCLNSYLLPIDREQVIKNIKEIDSNQVKNKILISTQVIEAGVDLDFDVGFRELSPLSSIIQTAGRVNREGKKSQSDIFIFDRLKTEIYSPILINETKKYLIGTLKDSIIEERDILKYIESYFESVANCLDDSKNILDSIKRFDFEQIDKSIKEIFKTEDDFTNSIALGVNLKELEKEYYEIEKKDKWELKRYREQKLKELSLKIVNIKKVDLEYCNANIENSEIFGIYYTEYLETIYSKKSGFLIQEEQQKNIFY